MHENENKEETVSSGGQQDPAQRQEPAQQPQQEPAQQPQQEQPDVSRIMDEIDTLRGEIVSLKDILGTLVTSTGPIVDKSDTIADTDDQDDGYRGLDAFDLTI